MKIEQLFTGCLAEMAYYIESNGEAAVVDPLRETAPYIQMAEADQAKIKYIFLTHFHADFVSGQYDLAHKTGARIIFGPNATAEYNIYNGVDGEDFFISEKQLKTALGNKKRDAIVIRTLPNLEDKKSIDYSNTNPPYLLESAAVYLREKGIKHLLIDVPSVDKEKDGGKLLAHNAFWNTAGKIRLNATITEFIYVPNTVKDGEYLLNLMIAPFENDATPSKPVLYEIIK